MDYHYYGTSEFGAQILQGLLNNNLPPSLVISTVPKPAGRKQELIPTPVSVLSQNNNLSIWEVSSLKTPEVINKLTQSPPSFAILASFGKIIPTVILNSYPKGIINIHPSLLPLYRGPSPIQSAIADGQTETGVSIMLLDEQVDHGPLLNQKTCSIDLHDNFTSLMLKLSDLTIGLLPSTINSYLNMNLLPLPQNHSQATYTKIITRADGQIDFSKSATNIYNQWRAFTPWPGLWTRWQGKRLKLIKLLPSNTLLPAKKIKLIDNNLYLGCVEGALQLIELQLEGGKLQTVTDFYRGHKNFADTMLD